MKSLNWRKKYKTPAYLITLVLLVLVFQSCSHKITFVNSPVVPAAEGSVKIKKDKNDNYNIELNVSHLAQPQKLDPPGAVYVVWIDTESNGSKNIGQLKTSRSLFSQALKSSLKTVSSFKPTKVFITAENDASVQYPDYRVVLTTNDF